MKKYLMKKYLMNRALDALVWATKTRADAWEYGYTEGQAHAVKTFTSKPEERLLYLIMSMPEQEDNPYRHKHVVVHAVVRRVSHMIGRVKHAVVRYTAT